MIACNSVVGSVSWLMPYYKLISLVRQVCYYQTLLRVNNYRFDMHPLIMQYSFEKLAVQKAEKQTVLAKHAEYFLDFAEAHPKDFFTVQQLPLIAQTEEELDNIWAALDWAYHTRNISFGLRLAAALYPFITVKGYYPELYQRLGHLLKEANPPEPSREHARALDVLAQLSIYLGHSRETQTLYQQRLDMYRRIDDKAGLAFALYCFVWSYPEAELDAKIQHIEASLALAREVEHQYHESECLFGLSLLNLSEDNFSTAAEQMSESLELKKAVGDVIGIARLSFHQGTVARYQGDYDRAKDLFEKSLELTAELNDYVGMGEAHTCLAELAIVRHHIALAKDHLVAGLRLWYQNGYRLVLQRLLNCSLYYLCDKSQLTQAAVVARLTYQLQKCLVRLFMER